MMIKTPRLILAFATLNSTSPPHFARFSKTLPMISALLLSMLLWQNSFGYNPEADACCECLTITVNGSTIDGNDVDVPSVIVTNNDGSVTLQVDVEENCDNVTVSSIIVRPVGSPGHTIDVANGQVTVPATDIVTYGLSWEVVVYCDNDEGEASSGCTAPFKVTSGCSSCDECYFSGSVSSEQSSENMQTTMPTTRGNGGSSGGSGGMITFDTAGLNFAGRSDLRAYVPSHYPVVKDGNGLLTKVETGVATIDIADVVGENAITLIHKDSTDAVFRTTKISKLNEGGVDRLRVDSTFENTTWRHERTQPQPSTFVLEKGKVVSGTFEPLSRETLVKTVSAPGVHVFRRTLEERSSVAATWSTSSDVETTHEKQVLGWVKIKEVIDPSGLALTSKWFYYQPGEVTGPNASIRGLGWLKQHTDYDGYQSFYIYALNYESITTPYAGDVGGKVTATTWDPGSKTRTTTTTAGGQVLSKTVTVYNGDVETQSVYTSSGSALTTVTTRQVSSSDFGGKPIKVQHPDGTLTTYAYTRNTGGGYTTVMDNGSTTDGNTVAQGMRTTTTTNSRGTTILGKTEGIGYGTGSALFGSMAVTSVDNLGRALVTAYHPEALSASGEQASASNPAWTTSTVYGCCGVIQETDQYGIPTYHAYDGLQRQIKSNRMGVTTETVRGGLTTESHRYAEAVSGSLSSALQGTSATLVSKSVRNLTGTLQESWRPDPTSATNGALIKSSSTATSFLNPQGPNIPLNLGSGIGRRTVTTTPDNFSQTTDSFFDGKTAKTYGDLSPAMQYAYTVNTTGQVTSQSYVDGTTLRETTTTQSDWAGRTLSNTYMDNATATMEYNSIGQMVKSTDPDGVTTLMLYDEEGERTITAIDLNNNGVIDYGVDTVQSSESDPALDSGNNPVMKSISKVWQPGDTSSTGGTIVSTSLETPNGLASASQSIGVANPSTSVTTLSGNGNWTTTSIAPDGTKSLSNYTAGRMVSMASLDTNNAVIESQAQAYDALNRTITSTNSRTGASTTNYLSTTADIVASVSDSGGRTTAFSYDVRGRQVSVNAPDTLDADGNTLTNVTTTSYNPDSTVAETNGDQTYRVSHTYDYADRQISMTTYGTTTATTTWQYSQTRGFLLAKRDAADKGANYTYTAAGRLATRTWARGVITTYSYDNGGRMVSTNYSDATPDVVMSHDAMGRQTTQSNGVATSTFSYNSSNLQIDTETIVYDLNADNTTDFTRVIDRSQDNLSRESGWQLKNGTSIENEVAYAYGTTDGRLSSVSKGTSSFGYTYVPNSNLLATVTSPVHTVSNVYETTRDVLASKVNKVNTTTISGYFYTVNNFGQRTGVNKDGTAFASTRDITWGYNAKGEVVKADNSVTGLDRSYQYDGIGNRLKFADSLTLPNENNYTPNALNQYAAIDSLTPSYDDDGNMTSGPLPANINANSTLIWDGENRLIVAQVTSGTTVNYVYDSQSRRIAETVGSNTTVYVYDDWNPMAEYNTTYALTKTYTWGVDLSGSMQNAGGVGGLLSVTDGTGTYFPTYDGNGNVSEYLDSNGNTVAHYEYDPFGKTTVTNGSKANDFAHRFSTKLLGLTTGLYYYGYRFYDPETGRWPSRDPIGERGGINLYGFIDNDSVNYIDFFGLRKCKDKGGSWVACRGVSDCCNARRAFWLKHLHEFELPDGETFCCDGRPVYCSFFWLDDDGGPNDTIESIVGKCIGLHEQYHLKRLKVTFPKGCGPDCGESTIPYKDEQQEYEEECEAHKISLKCLQKAIKKCDDAKLFPTLKGRQKCKTIIGDKLSNAEAYKESYCSQK